MSHPAMKHLLRTDHPAPRRLPLQDRQTEKGRKQETFDYGRLGCDQRSVAFALRMDRKR
jgi:hypothetical protein